MDNSAIKINGVSKTFRLPNEKGSKSVKSNFVNIFRGKSGYQLQTALNDISFEVKKGEFFGIVGRNGSGKSTLLKIIAGIYQPTKGSVQAEGKLVPFIELGVGFNPELTGKENVYLNGALLGFSTKEVDAQYKDIVSFAELGRFMGQKLKNYSSGMQVRLAFAMAVRAKAEILLIDEVLAVGDADFQRKCFNYFDQLRNKGVTVIFVSHDMDAVREYCDRALLIENSKILTIGSTYQVAQEYLKLFSGQKAVVANQESIDRWGDQDVYTDKTTININPDSISISQIIKAKKNTPSPIAGFRIKDASGKEVTGTNTKVESRKLQDLAKGQSVELNWVIPNILRDGEYTLDPAILHSDGITVADWWNEAERFTVKKDRHLPYTIDPGFKLSIKNK
jgi:ABC-2 type transport system ATP-binding protein